MKQRAWRWNEVESGGICAIVFIGLCPSTGMSPEACDAKGGGGASPSNVTAT